MRAGDLAQAGRPVVTPVPANGDTTKPPPVNGQHQEEAGAYPVITAADLLEVPDLPTPWLVPRFLPLEEVIVCMAHPKAGKTWFGVELGLSVALELPAFGTHLPTTSGPVLLWLSEDGTGNMKSRLKALMAGKDVGWDERLKTNLHIHVRDLARTVPGLRHMRLDVTDDTARAEFIEHARKVKPVLVVLDTMMSVAEAEDENSAGAMHRIMRCMREIRDALTCTVLVTHHMGKDNDTNSSRPIFQRARGSSAIRGAWDGAFAITPLAPDGTVQRFRVDFEMRGVEGGAAMPLRFEKSTDGNGRALSARFSPDNGDAVKAELDATAEKNSAVLKIVRTWFEEKGKRTPTKTFTKAQVRDGVERSNAKVAAAIDGLVEDGVVEAVKTPDTRTLRYRLAPRVPAAPPDAPEGDEQ